MNVVVTYGAPEPRPSCVICGTPYEKHGSYPTCASHAYSSGAVPDSFSADQMRQFWEAGRRAGLEEAAKLSPVAPWPDFAGQPIHHGDRLRHPNGDEFVAVRLHGYAEESDAWRAIYNGDGLPSRLGLQIGEKGRAVLI